MTNGKDRFSEVTVMDILQAVREDLPEILALQRIAFICEAEEFYYYSIDPMVQTLCELEELRIK
ncbi:MAG: hypothetical protein LIP12_00555 [Clostridiales bacterium]|nr:hypothetical protein [Clostridiales bacterium]